MSKDWTHVFAPGVSQASITFTNMQLEDRIVGEIHNRCPFSVFVRQAIAATSSGDGAQCENGPSESPEVELLPVLMWQTPHSARMDQCGHSIKVPRNGGDANVYQVEYSISGIISAQKMAPRFKTSRDGLVQG
ncbi:uncharacterized protein K460DRAFT_351763 [Cucurbitaria berberidis CBS 394.84]|uniref:Uncharacterized protein n=1 Tax=Cucurbitaria berberidis CBS 394.84 TaxID=1168544 RepID=A0A9P4GUR1_9PLEO|nr:uncharacterized protein K460DRAFT_351763 [Cucurbitaria berberidis CBS 394.84]KAF1851894.1 hypothetical protein K460DRAFT_351763 [Cucurbitaria berberidis CBS 394.84]